MITLTVTDTLNVTPTATTGRYSKSTSGMGVLIYSISTGQAIDWSTLTVLQAGTVLAARPVILRELSVPGAAPIAAYQSLAVLATSELTRTDSAVTVTVLVDGPIGAEFGPLAVAECVKASSPFDPSAGTGFSISVSRLSADIEQDDKLGYKAALTITEAVGLPRELFLCRRTPADLPVTSVLEEFEGVCGIPEIYAYPAGAPNPEVGPFYRVNTVTLSAWTSQQLYDTYHDIIAELEELITVLRGQSNLTETAAVTLEG